MANNGGSVNEQREDDVDPKTENDQLSDMHPKAVRYIKELLTEKNEIDHQKFPTAVGLMDKELEKVQQTGRAPPKDNKFVDVLSEKPIKVSTKVLVPVRKFPKFNFVGKILGPKGNSLKRLQEDTMCRIIILGRGSMRDRNKEEELRNSLEPKYSHLSEDLNIEISAFATPSEAYARMAYALTEVQKYLIPDKNDNISVDQMLEMEKMGVGAPYQRGGQDGDGYRPVARGPQNRMQSYDRPRNQYAPYPSNNYSSNDDYDADYYEGEGDADYESGGQSNVRRNTGYGDGQSTYRSNTGYGGGASTFRSPGGGYGGGYGSGGNSTFKKDWNRGGGDDTSNKMGAKPTVSWKSPAIRSSNVASDSARFRSTPYNRPNFN